MGLPKQQLPTYTVLIPSTKKKVTFRGFTVKEEKILLLAQETEDPDTILDSVKQILTNCIVDPINPEDFTMFDIEFLITQIRARSVGEIVQLQMACDADPTHERTLIAIDTSTIDVKFPEGHETTIHLYGNVHIKMRYPTLRDIVALENATGIDAVILCIDSIYTDDEVFHAKDQTKQELSEFIDALTKPQLQQIEEKFFDKMPSFYHEFSYKCKVCGHDHTKVIKGIGNFFG